MISDRLLIIASLVDNDAIVADIGSDHALLPIYLVKEKIASKAYAIDNKEGPLNAAIKNIKQYDLNETVKTRLASGLNDLEADVDTVIIAGMGYKSISMIIENDIERAKILDSLIIQCNNHLSSLRYFLNQNGFHVVDEKFIEINKQKYNIMKIRYKGFPLEEVDYYVSQTLINKQDIYYLDYLRRRQEHLYKLKEYNKEFLNEFKSIQKALKE